MNEDLFLRCEEWRRVRMMVLERDGAKCACCGATAKAGAVLNVDHVKPRRYHPELALTLANLQVLCSVCNHGKGNQFDTDWRGPPPRPTRAKLEEFARINGLPVGDARIAEEKERERQRALVRERLGKEQRSA
jgi:5-methylcytosine-specific restriction endonuclease McrA